MTDLELVDAGCHGCGYAPQYVEQADARIHEVDSAIDMADIELIDAGCHGCGYAPQYV